MPLGDTEGLSSRLGGESPRRSNDSTPDRVSGRGCVFPPGGGRHRCRPASPLQRLLLALLNSAPSSFHRSEEPLLLRCARSTSRGLPSSLALSPPLGEPSSPGCACLPCRYRGLQGRGFIASLRADLADCSQHGLSFLGRGHGWSGLRHTTSWVFPRLSESTFEALPRPRHRITRESARVAPHVLRIDFEDALHRLPPVLPSGSDLPSMLD